jgi:hypothetical protein
MFIFLSLLACQDSPQNSEVNNKASQKEIPEVDKKAGNPKAGKPEVKSSSAKGQASDGCTYMVKEAKPEWTAYKYTEKAAVGGTFNSFSLSSPKLASSFVASMEGLSIEIDASSVESKNPARNKTIAEKYFFLFAPQNIIKGNVVSATGDEEKGSIEINIDMNGVQKPYTFTYTQKEGKVIASSVMDMMDFQLQKPFDSIHTSCETLHTGADGVSKTWTEVALRVVVSYEKTCQ